MTALLRLVLFQPSRLSLTLSSLHYHKLIYRKINTCISVRLPRYVVTSPLMCSIDHSVAKIPTCLIQRRNFFKILFRVLPFLSKDPKVLIKHDGISKKDYVLVYMSSISSMVFWIQTVVATLMVSSVPMIILSYPVNVPVDPSQFYYFETITEITAGIIGLVVLSCSLLVIIQRVPLRIYHSQEKKNFILIYQSVFPWRTWSRDCAEGAVTVLGLSVWNSLFGNHKLKGKKLVISEDRFRFPVYYNKLLGHVNKPLDKDSK